MLSRQAKILTKAQIQATLDLIGRTRAPARNRVILLLSVRAGLRAKEIAHLTWGMVTDAEGALTDTIYLTNSASKGTTGGVSHLLSDNSERHMAIFRTEAVV